MKPEISIAIDVTHFSRACNRAITAQNQANGDHICHRSYPSDNLPGEAAVMLCAPGERMSAFSNLPHDLQVAEYIRA